MKFWNDIEAKAAAHELAELRKRMPAFVTQAARDRANLERLMVLGGLGEQDPLWRVILSYADEHAQNERDAALSPGLTDGDRQYRAGRAASAEDFCTALRALRVKAQREARKG